MNEDDKDLIREMTKSKAWELASKKVLEDVANFKNLATQQKCELNDRLWYSAVAQGIEHAINQINELGKIIEKK